MEPDIRRRMIRGSAAQPLMSGAAGIAASDGGAAAYERSESWRAGSRSLET